MVLDNFKKLCFICIIILVNPTTAIAQNWNVHGAERGGRVMATITKLDKNRQIITAKIETDKQAGQYRIGYCQVTDFTELKKNGSRIKFSQLRVGDRVYAEGVVMKNQRRECALIEVRNE